MHKLYLSSNELVYNIVCYVQANSYIIYHYYYYFGVRCARPGESEDTLSVRRPQPHTTNPWKEEKDKTVGDKKERTDHANRKALALLLKPASLTPSNTGSLRSFQRDTERAVMQGWEEEIYTLAVRRPQPDNTNPKKNKRIRK